MFRTLLLSTAIAAVSSSSSFAADPDLVQIDNGRFDGPSFYVGGAYILSDMSVDSGGLNTAGPFTGQNCTLAVCDDEENNRGWSAIVGIDNFLPITDGTSIRVEGEYSHYNSLNYVTGSFPGSKKPAFIYRTKVNDINAAFANAYIDFDIGNNLKLYGGGGIGMSWIDVKTNDTVVRGSGSHSQIAYNYGVGLRYEFIPNFELFGNVRQVNLGETDTKLKVGGTNAGKYKLDHESTEFRLGLIVKLGR